MFKFLLTLPLILFLNLMKILFKFSEKSLQIFRTNLGCFINNLKLGFKEKYN